MDRKVGTRGDKFEARQIGGRQTGDGQEDEHCHQFSPPFPPFSPEKRGNAGTTLAVTFSSGSL